MTLRDKTINFSGGRITEGACASAADKNYVDMQLMEKFPGKPIAEVTPLHRLNEAGPGTAGMKEKNFIPAEYADARKELAADSG